MGMPSVRIVGGTRLLRGGLGVCMLVHFSAIAHISSAVLFARGRNSLHDGSCWVLSGVGVSGIMGLKKDGQNESGRQMAWHGMVWRG